MQNVKRIFMAALIGLLCAGALSVHGHGRGRGAGPWYNTATETVTVSGTLQLVEGQIAVVSGGITYYTRSLQRLVGFVDGLKEGATVRLEGVAGAVPLNANARFLWVSKLTINGKDYSFPTPTPGRYW
jgi:hypothetical protein